MKRKRQLYKAGKAFVDISAVCQPTQTNRSIASFHVTWVDATLTQTNTRNLERKQMYRVHYRVLVSKLSTFHLCDYRSTSL